MQCQHAGGHCRARGGSLVHNVHFKVWLCIDPVKTLTLTVHTRTFTCLTGLLVQFLWQFLMYRNYPESRVAWSGDSTSSHHHLQAAGGPSYRWLTGLFQALIAMWQMIFWTPLDFVANFTLMVSKTLLAKTLLCNRRCFSFFCNSLLHLVKFLAWYLFAFKLLLYFTGLCLHMSMYVYTLEVCMCVFILCYPRVTTWMNGLLLYWLHFL